MKVSVIIELASHLYHEDYDNPLRLFLYEATKGEHSNKTVDLKKLEPHSEEIRELLSKTRYQMKVSFVKKKVVQNFPYGKNLILAKKLRSEIRKKELSETISVDLSFEEMDILEKYL